MMKHFLAFFIFLMPLPASARPVFKYYTTCVLESSGTVTADVCTVVETRETSGALKTRNIYSDRFGLTIKSRSDKENGFVTWDSHNQFEYKWNYVIGNYNGTQPYTYVMPGILVENVSWN